jgi:hypothetical protein
VRVLDDRPRVGWWHDVSSAQWPVIAAAKAGAGDPDGRAQRDLGVGEDGGQHSQPPEGARSEDTPYDGTVKNRDRGAGLCRDRLRSGMVGAESG